MTAELLGKYQREIETLTLIPSSGGRFEVIVDDSLIFSKKALGRHAEPGEVAGILERDLGFVDAAEE